jgi:hypothetical protein
LNQVKKNVATDAFISMRGGLHATFDRHGPQHNQRFRTEQKVFMALNICVLRRCAGFVLFLSELNALTCLAQPISSEPLPLLHPEPATEKSTYEARILKPRGVQEVEMYFCHVRNPLLLGDRLRVAQTVKTVALVAARGNWSQSA